MAASKRPYRRFIGWRDTPGLFQAGFVGSAKWFRQRGGRWYRPQLAGTLRMAAVRPKLAQSAPMRPGGNKQ
jgi:hypothetical protein